MAFNFRHLPRLTRVQAPVVIVDGSEVVPDLIKHPIDAKKVFERISTLSELYRLQNGGLNRIEYCGSARDEGARTTAAVVRAVGSAGRLRVRQVDKEVTQEVNDIEDLSLSSYTSRQKPYHFSPYKRPPSMSPGSGRHDDDTDDDCSPRRSRSPSSTEDDERVQRLHTSQFSPESEYNERDDISSSDESTAARVTTQQIPSDLLVRLETSEAALNIDAGEGTDVYERQRNIELALQRMQRDDDVPSSPEHISPPEDDMTLEELDEEIWTLSAEIKRKQLSNAFN